MNKVITYRVGKGVHSTVFTFRKMLLAAKTTYKKEKLTVELSIDEIEQHNSGGILAKNIICSSHLITLTFIFSVGRSLNDISVFLVCIFSNFSSLIYQR